MRRLAQMAMLCALAGPAALAQDGEAMQRALRDSPAVRLGARVMNVKAQIAVAPVVVLAETEGAYCEAISLWSTRARFPVLYDDGSPEAAEWIARFVRAFGPERVVRLSEASEAWQTGSREERIERALRRAWGGEERSVADAIRGLGGATAGVVLAARNDPSWTAALALAAGHAQPLKWIDRSGGLGGTIDAAGQDALRGQVEAAAEATGFSWRDLGDEIEAVTLCWNGALKAGGIEKAPLALADLLGRHVDGRRWAWGGIMVGGETAASVRAMSPLFLRVRDAWLFNGYGSDGGFAAYEMQSASELLGRAGFQTITDDAPHNGPDVFRQRGRFGVRGGLVQINSAGYPTWFQLGGAKAETRDLPMLESPSIVHFVHSFSMQNVGNEGTIGRRVLDNGAGAYVGAIDEPYLNAFHPPKLFTARLLASAPLGAVAYRDGAPPWKVNVLGDPLWTISPARAPEAEIPEIPAAEALDETLRAALQEREFATAMRLLVVRGRDADAVRLAQAVGEDDASSLTPDLCRLALGPAIRTGQTELVVQLIGPLAKTLRGDRRLADLVWLVMGPELGRTSSPLVVERLRAIIRDHALAHDAIAVAGASARVTGPAAAAAILNEAIARTKSDETRRRLADALSKHQ